MASDHFGPSSDNTRAMPLNAATTVNTDREMTCAKWCATDRVAGSASGEKLSPRLSRSSRPRIDANCAGARSTIGATRAACSTLDRTELTGETLSRKTDAAIVRVASMTSRSGERSDRVPSSAPRQRNAAAIDGGTLNPAVTTVRSRSLNNTSAGIPSIRMMRSPIAHWVATRSRPAGGMRMCDSAVVAAALSWRSIAINNDLSPRRA